MAVAFLVVAAASIVVVAIVTFPDATFVVTVATAFVDYVAFVLLATEVSVDVAALFVTFPPDVVVDAILHALAAPGKVVDHSSWEEGLRPPVLSSATPFKNLDHKRIPLHQPSMLL